MIPRFNIKRIKNRLGGTTSITPPPKFQREVLVEQWVARTSTKDAEKYARGPSKLFEENPILDRMYRMMTKDYDVFVDFPFVIFNPNSDSVIDERPALFSGTEYYVLATDSKADRDRPSQWYLTDIEGSDYIRGNKHWSRVRTIWDDKMGDEERIFTGQYTGRRL